MQYFFHGLTQYLNCFCKDCCGVTEAARRDGGAATAPTPPTVIFEEEEVAEGRKDWGMVVKEVLLGLVG